MTEDYRPRLAVDISEEQQRKLWKYFEHGELKIVFNVIVDDLIRILDQHGRVIIGLIGARYAKTDEIFPSLNAAVEGAKRIEKGNNNDQ